MGNILRVFGGDAEIGDGFCRFLVRGFWEGRKRAIGRLFCSRLMNSSVKFWSMILRKFEILLMRRMPALAREVNQVKDEPIVSTS